VNATLLELAALAAQREAGGLKSSFTPSRRESMSYKDEIFGNNTALAGHLANYSNFRRAVATWDAATKTIKV
jgi:hypothetical protein